MIKASDIMQTNLITVTQDTPAPEAINILGQNSITGLPVVDDDMTLIGLVSEKDVLNMAYRIMTDTIGDPIMSQTVGDIMTKEIVSFRPDDSLADVCQCFMNRPFRRVPVVDNGKLVGLISRKDIISHSFTKNKKNK